VSESFKQLNIIRDALVVGINNYQYARGLKSPATNAEAIAKVLEAAKFNVTRLPRTKTDGVLSISATGTITRKQLQEAITRVFQPPEETTPQTALLFFSGHGLREDIGVSEGYLATSDANPESGVYGISLQWLRRLLDKSSVKEQLVWLDCCHSGELLNFQENLHEARLGNQESYSRCFIAASREDEKALGNLTSPYGELTHALLRGLDPSNSPNGWVTSAILTEAVNRFLTVGEQHPIAYNFGSPIILTTGRKTQQSKDEPPYKGLEYFAQEDADLFYGRTVLTNDLLQKVDESNFLALLGASGSGKSSVLRAGLLHQLSLGRNIPGSHTWKLEKPFTPGEHPLQNLEKAIGKRRDELEAFIAEVKAERVVMVIDQFEECFTLCQDKQERQQFFDFLLNVLERLGKKICLVLGIRADFLGKYLEYPQLAKHIRNSQESVAPMTETELTEAIIEPAKQVGLQVEESLVNRLLEDVQNSPGSLPLLQYTLNELWKARKEPAKDWLTLASYEELGGEKGGIRGILEKRANQVYNNLHSLEEQLVAKHIFLSLTHLNEDAEDTRQRKRIADLVTPRYPEALINKVVNELANEKSRLIVTRLAENESNSGEAVVEVAHEILIREWGLLRGWINEGRKYLLQQKEIEAAAEKWRDRKKSKDFLYTGKRLKEAKEFQKEQADLFPLSALTSNFIRASIQRRRQKTGIMSLGFLVAAIPLIVTSNWLAIFIKDIGYDKYQAGQIEDAIIYYNIALTIKPGYPEALYSRGRAYEELKDFNRAIADYESARASDRFASAYSQLARLYITEYQNYPRAAQLSEEALQFAKNDFQRYPLYKNWGWALFELQQYDKAQDALQKAIIVNNQRGSAYCLLAQVLEAQSLFIKAKQEWKKCQHFGDSEIPEEKTWIEMAKQRFKK
jgi:tetratricopeptide (TPR) repeat protein